jgi:hypothetical protein
MPDNYKKTTQNLLLPKKSSGGVKAAARYEDWMHERVAFVLVCGA